MPEALVTTHGAQETEDLGAAIGRALVPGDVVALVGPLGAGKTTFVRGVVRGRGGDPRDVLSPTFVLARRYEAGGPLWHLDAFRLSGPADLRDLDPGLYLGAGSIALVEWADRVEGALPPGGIRIEFAHASEHERTVRVEAAAGVWERIAPAVGPG